MPEQGRRNQEQGIERFAAAVARLRVPLSFLIGAVVLWTARPTLRSLCIGGAIAVGGEAFRIWASGHLEKGREVTQSGPYRLTRHPLYAGSAIIAVGAAVAAARISVALLIGASMAISILSAIRHEEASMRAAFGDEYDAYADSRAKPVHRPFSFSRAMRVNKEYKAVVGLGAVAAILAVKAIFWS